MSEGPNQGSGVARPVPTRVVPASTLATPDHQHPATSSSLASATVSGTAPYRRTYLAPSHAAPSTPVGSTLAPVAATGSSATRSHSQSRSSTASGPSGITSTRAQPQRIAGVHTGIGARPVAGAAGPSFTSLSLRGRKAPSYSSHTLSSAFTAQQQQPTSRVPVAAVAAAPVSAAVDAATSAPAPVVVPVPVMPSSTSRIRFRPTTGVAASAARASAAVAGPPPPSAPAAPAHHFSTAVHSAAALTLNVSSDNNTEPDSIAHSSGSPPLGPHAHSHTQHAPALALGSDPPSGPGSSGGSGGSAPAAAAYAHGLPLSAAAPVVQAPVSVPFPHTAPVLVRAPSSPMSYSHTGAPHPVHVSGAGTGAVVGIHSPVTPTASTAAGASGGAGPGGRVLNPHSAANSGAVPGSALSALRRVAATPSAQHAHGHHGYHAHGPVVSAAGPGGFAHASPAAAAGSGSPGGGTPLAGRPGSVAGSVAGAAHGVVNGFALSVRSGSNSPQSSTPGPLPTVRPTYSRSGAPPHAAASVGAGSVAAAVTAGGQGDLTGAGESMDSSNSSFVSAASAGFHGHGYGYAQHYHSQAHGQGRYAPSVGSSPSPPSPGAGSAVGATLGTGATTPYGPAVPGAGAAASGAGGVAPTSASGYLHLHAATPSLHLSSKTPSVHNQSVSLDEYVTSMRKLSSLAGEQRRLQRRGITDKSQTVVALPRGGSYVATSIGPVQVGCPPETIKDSMAHGLPLPSTYVLPRERFNLEMGISVAEFEFPAYFSFFIKRQRVRLVVHPDAEATIRRIFSLTLLGPDASSIKPPPHYSAAVPKEAYPDLEKEMSFFRVNPFDRSPLTVDSVLEFVHFDDAGFAQLGDGVLVQDTPGGEFVFWERGAVVATVPATVALSPTHPALRTGPAEIEQPPVAPAGPAAAPVPAPAPTAVLTVTPTGPAASAAKHNLRRPSVTVPVSVLAATAAAATAAIAATAAPNAPETSEPHTPLTGASSASLQASPDIGPASGPVPGPAPVTLTLTAAASSSAAALPALGSPVAVRNRRASLVGQNLGLLPRAVSGPSVSGGAAAATGAYEHFVPPHFGVTMLGVSDGFDAQGTTTGFVIWLNRRGVMVDPPPHSSYLLQQYGIHPRLIKCVVLTHCHADHDAGTFQKILEEGRVSLLTTQVIYDMFLEKYSLISGLSQRLLQELFVFRPVIPGESVAVYGGRLNFFYALHSIPCVGLTAHCNGKSMVYSGDYFNDPTGIRKIYEQGLMSAERMEKLIAFPWHHDLILHEAGVPPIHTPIPTLQALPDDVKARLRVVHTNPAKFPSFEETKLKMCSVGPEYTMVLSDSPAPDASSLEVLDVVLALEWMSDLPLHRAVELIQAARFLTVPAGGTIIREGTCAGDDEETMIYFLSMGTVAVTIGGRFIRHMTMGDHFGEVSLLLNTARSASIVAATRAELIAFTRHDFLHLLRDTPIVERLTALSDLRTSRTWQTIMANTILGKFTSAQKNSFMAMLQERSVAAGEPLWVAGGLPDAAFLVSEGSLHFDAAADAAPFRRGALVGDMSVLIEGPEMGVNHQCSLYASEDSVVYAIARADLLAFFANNPGFHVYCMGRMFVE